VIGLHRNTVQLSPHQKLWGTYFLTVKSIISEQLNGYFLDIQHIGSTSIQGIAAKPIIDIGILIKDETYLSNCIQVLEAIGYIYRGDAGNSGGHLFVKEIVVDVRTEHLHIIEQGDIQWQNYLEFRDYLNANSIAAEAYSKLKQSSAIQYPNDRKAYTASKTKFIQQILNTKR